MDRTRLYTYTFIWMLCIKTPIHLGSWEARIYFFSALAKSFKLCKRKEVLTERVASLFLRNFETEVRDKLSHVHSTTERNGHRVLWWVLLFVLPFFKVISYIGFLQRSSVIFTPQYHSHSRDTEDSRLLSPNGLYQSSVQRNLCYIPNRACS